ncbi:MAG: pyruvate dehydrogenase (acetyl-transferring), homodimeric type [Nitriliruptoraceae bacterium]|nr:pyruvate dehydrogenase (acetyl-transferring), homodimeric type [Nitriliruptoraceae bacterium]
MREQQQFVDNPIITDGFPAQYPDIDEVETTEWLQSFDAVVEEHGKARGRFLLLKVLERARQQNIGIPSLTTTDYINTIPPEREPSFPGDEDIERRIRHHIRWNAAVMVHRTNVERGTGGHIGTYASAASLYEVGFNHFFRGKDHPGGGDQVFFQGHASPGIYARAFLEGRLDEQQLDRFRAEVEPGGLSSYPHPRLMPEFWEFPTVSMGLGPLHAIYQARFNRYLHNRGFSDTSDQHVWFFGGDGETAEPETLGALAVASREGLDNLTFVINCNLQQLDGPVRGNGKIVQELEGVFRGAGWNVVKVLWGREWDPLLAKDVDGALIARMNEVPDGELQTYPARGPKHIREGFFGANPKLKKLIDDWSDDDIAHLRRGGHDYRKVYAAYQAAMQTSGAPTVILAQTVKGWTLGPDFEARNAVHQMKKLSSDSLKAFRDRLGLDVSDEALEGDLPPYSHPGDDAEEIEYLKERRSALGGAVPERRTVFTVPTLPEHDAFGGLKEGSGKQQVATTMALVRLFKDLLRTKEFGKRIVPIIPDEARTFGMDSWFPTAKIYDHLGQTYEPVDQELLLSYKQAKDGQIIHEGITEAGSMASFHAVGTSYATHGEPLIPLYIFYSMFGFQRTADSIWSAADQRSRGFLIGATAGGTTLNGEGLQHQDRHSLLMAQSNPGVEAYDPSFAYELAVLVEHGLKRMYSDETVEGGEDVIFYLTVYNEPAVQPAMPEHVDDQQVIDGLYRFREGEQGQHRANILSSGTIMNEALRAQQLLAEDWDVAADVWSAPGWNRLLRDGVATEAWNRTNPDGDPRVPLVTRILEGTEGPYVAVSDWMRATPFQIADWVPGPFAVLGTDGFGRSDTREALRRYHRVDAASITYCVLAELVKQGALDADVLPKVIERYELAFERIPFFGQGGSTDDVTR